AHVPGARQQVGGHLQPHHGAIPHDQQHGHRRQRQHDGKNAVLHGFSSSLAAGARKCARRRLQMALNSGEPSVSSRRGRAIGTSTTSTTVPGRAESTTTRSARYTASGMECVM
ncbi:MAG: hypothetical protein ACK56I_18105, partial [bacterium]